MKAIGNTVKMVAAVPMYLCLAPLLPVVLLMWICKAFTTEKQIPATTKVARPVVDKTRPAELAINSSSWYLHFG